MSKTPRKKLTATLQASKLGFTQVLAQAILSSLEMATQGALEILLEVEGK
jgi:hypothetical protein